MNRVLLDYLEYREHRAYRVFRASRGPTVRRVTKGRRDLPDPRDFRVMSVRKARAVMSGRKVPPVRKVPLVQMERARH